MSDAESLRCPTCGSPHKDNPDASAQSGHGWVYEWDSGECPVCEMWRERMEQKARPFLLDRQLRETEENMPSTDPSDSDDGDEQDDRTSPEDCGVGE